MLHLVIRIPDCAPFQQYGAWVRETFFWWRQCERGNLEILGGGIGFGSIRLAPILRIALTLDRAIGEKKKWEPFLGGYPILFPISVPLSLSSHDPDPHSHGDDSDDYPLSGIGVIRTAQFPAMTQWPSR